MKHIVFLHPPPPPLSYLSDIHDTRISISTRAHHYHSDNDKSIASTSSVAMGLVARNHERDSPSSPAFLDKNIDKFNSVGGLVSVGCRGI